MPLRGRHGGWAQSPATLVEGRGGDLGRGKLSPCHSHGNPSCRAWGQPLGPPSSRRHGEGEGFLDRTSSACSIGSQISKLLFPRQQRGWPWGHGERASGKPEALGKGGGSLFLDCSLHACMFLCTHAHTHARTHPCTNSLEATPLLRGQIPKAPVVGTLQSYNLNLGL